MGYQHIEGLNPSHCLTDYICTIMMDTDNERRVRLMNYRQVKDEVQAYEAWLEEISDNPINNVTGPLIESVEADLKKWRQAIKQYQETK